MSSGRTSRDAVNTFGTKLPEWQCGVYLRLSREDGDKMESDSIANQRRITDKFIEKNPELNVYDTYIDDGFSGTNFNRPNVIRLLEDIKSRKVNCLIVKDLSRFGRNYHEVGRYIEVVFPLLRLRFISVNDTIDSYKNPASVNSSVSFKNVMNDEYGRDISNKVKGTFNAKRKRGDFIGSFAPYGYRKSPENHNKLIIDQEAAENVRMIYQMFLDGMSVFNICGKLGEMEIPNPTAYKVGKGYKAQRKTTEKTKGLWGDNTVRRLLQSRVYLGDLIQKRNESVSYKLRVNRMVPKEKNIVVKNNHEPIIDIDTFDRAQALFKRDSWQPRKEGAAVNDVGNGAIFVGYVKCADCGRTMNRAHVVRPYKRYYYFKCATYRLWKRCTIHSTPVEKIEKAVLALIQKHVAIAVETESLLKVIHESPVRNNALMRVKKAIENKVSERAKLTRYLNDLYPDFKDELITKEQYLQFKNESEAFIAEIDAALKTLNEQAVREENGIDDSNDFIAAFKKYRNITALTREIVVELIDMIYVEESGGIRIDLKYRDLFERLLEVSR
ncbi:recombinase [Clostridia bacterium]|nr:recombinase [Clostridia bacterium]